MVGLCPCLVFCLGLATEILEHCLSGFRDAVLFREVHHTGTVALSKQIKESIAHIFVRVHILHGLRQSFVDIEDNLAEGLCARLLTAKERHHTLHVTTLQTQLTLQASLAVAGILPKHGVRTDHGRYMFLQAPWLRVVQDGKGLIVALHLLTCINQRLVFLVTFLAVTLNGFKYALPVYLTLFLFTQSGFLGLALALFLALCGFDFCLTCCGLIPHLFLNGLINVLPVLDDVLLLLLLTFDLHSRLCNLNRIIALGLLLTDFLQARLCICYKVTGCIACHELVATCRFDEGCGCIFHAGLVPLVLRFTFLVKYWLSGIVCQDWYFRQSGNRLLVCSSTILGTCLTACLFSALRRLRLWLLLITDSRNGFRFSLF